MQSLQYPAPAVVISRKYPNSDRAFGEPPLFSCTDSYKRVLEAHLAEAVAKITRSYEVDSRGTSCGGLSVFT